MSEPLPENRTIRDMEKIRIGERRPSCPHEWQGLPADGEHWAFDDPRYQEVRCALCLVDLVFYIRLYFQRMDGRTPENEITDNRAAPGL